MVNELVGKTYTFDDGNTINVVQVKLREEHGQVIKVVTYQIITGNGIPQKLILPEKDFVNQFGHLFGLKAPPDKPHY